MDLLETSPGLVCPITQTLMIDPVIGPDGYTYERSAIKDWLDAHGVSPMTRQRMSAADLRPNRAVRNQIEWLLQGNPTAAAAFRQAEAAALSCATRPMSAGGQPENLKHRLQAELMGGSGGPSAPPVNPMKHGSASPSAPPAAPAPAATSADLTDPYLVRQPGLQPGRPFIPLQPAPHPTNPSHPTVAAEVAGGDQPKRKPKKKRSGKDLTRDNLYRDVDRPYRGGVKVNTRIDKNQMRGGYGKGATVSTGNKDICTIM
mmetsp:Transcript_26001/g.72819  ORF Transcript_26001/g.72819 Transcript_26001/m.72819 type:complete len:259 (+) Transcript_26001:374-1150(+)